MKKNAFTLAEVLITLTIVGVVSAITLPVFINKINNNEYDKARKKALNSIGQATKMLASQDRLISASNAQDFVENYLSKQLKIIKTCSSAADCQLTGSNNGSSNLAVGYSIFGNLTKEQKKSYSFITSDGYSYTLYYNPNCTQDWWGLNSVCVHTIYDMNGRKGPNKAGKDIGVVTVHYPSISTVAVAPNPAEEDVGSFKYEDAQNACQNQGKDYRLPNKEELSSILFSYTFLDRTAQNGSHMSSDTYKIGNNTVVRAICESACTRMYGWYGTARKVRCLKH